MCAKPLCTYRSFNVLFLDSLRPTHLLLVQLALKFLNFCKELISFFILSFEYTLTADWVQNQRLLFYLRLSLKALFRQYSYFINTFMHIQVITPFSC
jgi:hypothetical protein